MTTEVSKIKSNSKQPRKIFQGIEELSASIKTNSRQLLLGTVLIHRRIACIKAISTSQRSSASCHNSWAKVESPSFLDTFGPWNNQTKTPSSLATLNAGNKSLSPANTAVCVICLFPLNKAKSSPNKRSVLFCWKIFFPCLSIPQNAKRPCLTSNLGSAFKAAKNDRFLEYRLDSSTVGGLL